MIRRLFFVLVVFGGSAGVLVADEFSKLVESAIADEGVLFGEIVERFEKNKLRPGESVWLFGKKKLTKQQQKERIEELRKQVEVGEVSFRSLSLALNDLKIGQAGVLLPKFQTIVCDSIDDDGTDFFGSYRIGESGVVRGQIVKSDRLSLPLVFRDVPGSENLVARKSITISSPMIVVGRRADTFVIQSLAGAVKQVREKK